MASSTDNNIQYLRFSAYSIKDLITRKLSEDTRFTDQVYEGSNLAILIDIVSYMYQCLMYQLNSAAAEAMFSDTQIYENINRLCKFIGYNPKGYSPSTTTFTITNKQNLTVNQGSFKKYSTIYTKLSDANGRKVYYSLVKDEDLNVNNDATFIFYNGIWKLYPTIFTSSGEAFQTFVLDDLKSDSNSKQYVSDSMIHVYVKDSLNQNIFKQWTATSDGLFMANNTDNGSYIHTSTDTIYNVRLNENKVYELSFGDNTTGEIPEKDAQIFIMYLDSNDETLQLNPYDVENAKIVHNKSVFGMSSDVYKGIFGADEDIDSSNMASGTIYSDAKWSNTEKSSYGLAEESVDEIRRNAPQWFKTGNRLVTASDYEYFIKNRFKSDILDVKCQNNAEYISTFYRWLYNIGVKKHNSGDYYITPNRLTKYDLKYSDAADMNNVYIWIKMIADAEIYKNVLNSEITSIKTLTHEPVYLKPLDVYFAPCAQTEEQAMQMYFSNDTTMFDANNYSYFEITIDNNTLYANSNIQQQIATKIQNFFNEDNFKLGQLVNYNDLLDDIYEIGSITNVRTVYYNTETGEKRIQIGLSFATWTSTFIDYGDDLEISTNSRSLETFQFPILYNSANIASKIKVIRKSVNNINTVQY